MNGQADGQLAGEREAEAGAAAHVLPGGEVPRAAPAPPATKRVRKNTNVGGTYNEPFAAKKKKKNG